MRIAAVGDSVMWGQGLMPPLNPGHFEDQEKFFFKIVEWLQNEGKVQEFDMNDFQAHSGAIIGIPDQKNRKAILSIDDAPNKEVFDRFYGEIPDDFPTILRQLDNLKDGNTIDLLIINGGPNDVGILKSVDFEEAFKEGLKLIDEVADNKLPVLLKEAQRKCPNALIIYTGYYPAISEKSSAIEALGAVNILAPPLRFVAIDEFLGSIFLAINHQRLKDQGVIFHQRMLAKFREQIANFNDKRDPSSLPIIFCPSGFGISNAMFTPNQMIFTTEEDSGVTGMRKSFCQSIHQKKKIHQLFMAIDSQHNISGAFKEFRDRYGAIYEQINSNEQIKEFSKLFCEKAFLAHPNKKGAEQYYKQLRKRIEIQLNFKLRKQIESMDKSISSLRKLKEKYPFIPLKSLRGLSDVLWLDVILVTYHISSYAGPTREFLSILYFDFGWGYQKCRNQDGEFVLDLSDRRRLSSLKHIKIRLPEFKGTISKLKIDFYIKINGYPLPSITLTERSFQKSGDFWVWEMPVLNYKPENN
jgi:hypothetical protein